MSNRENWQSGFSYEQTAGEQERSAAESFARRYACTVYRNFVLAVVDRLVGKRKVRRGSLSSIGDKPIFVRHFEHVATYSYKCIHI